MAFRKDMVELFKRACRGFHTNVVVADVIKGILQVRRGVTNIVEASPLSSTGDRCKCVLCECSWFKSTT